MILAVFKRHGKDRAVRTSSHDPDSCPVCHAVDLIEAWIARFFAYMAEQKLLGRDPEE
jgi:hypothetical protein